jgi:stage II sporulation protein D
MTRRRTAPVAAVVGGLTAAALTLGGGSVLHAAAGTPSIRVPHHATLVVHGRGYGHGHGMSQYGAEGAARAGLSAKKIVHFYYPHTRPGTFRGRVRVLISADTDHDTTVAARAGLKVHDLARGTTVALPTTGKAAKATRWRLSSRRGKPADVSYLTGSWHVWRTLSGDGEFKAPKPIRLVLAGGPVAYRGSVQSRTSTAGGTPHRITVNKVSMESYVRAVVPREAFPSWHQAALRAQAIAARSYAAFEVKNSTNKLYQLCDTSACQVYGGVPAEVSTTDEATDRTAGQIRTYHGRPAFTQFSSSNGGRLAAGSQPYLVAKPDPYDGWSGNPNHTWRTTVTSAAIEKAFPSLGDLTSITVTKRDGQGKWGGRVTSMKLVGASGTVTPSGDTFRGALGLRSTWFTIAVS